MNMSERFDRNIRLFGVDGQRKLRDSIVAIVGVGGLGSAVAQHLALLGVGKIVLVDDQEIDETNRNRFIGATRKDRVPGTQKVSISMRLIQEIDGTIVVEPIYANLLSEAAFFAVKNADFVFGCLDEDGPRAILNELCAAYKKPYFDLASDVPEPGSYGGRVCVSWDGNGCLLCMEEIDGAAVQKYLQTDAQRLVHDDIYGVERAALAETGPSVSPINGVIASLGCMEFMASVTGMRRPSLLLNYRGHLGIVSVAERRQSDCFICNGVRGQGDIARVDRYLQILGA
jgi:molybdopterin-synthase adenylyltransferase